MGKGSLWQKVTVMEADFPAFNHIHTGRVEGSAGEGPKYTLPKKKKRKNSVSPLLQNIDLLVPLHPANPRRKDNQRKYSKGQVCDKHVNALRLM